MENPAEVLEVEMPTDLYNDLQDLAEARGTSIENVMLDALIEFVVEYKLNEKKKAEFANRAKKSLNLEG